MAFKRYCDKCGAEMGPYKNDCGWELDISVGYKVNKVDCNDPDVVVGRRYLDLCPDCRKKLENVVRRNLAECIPAPEKAPRARKKDTVKL